jgi:AcrR family transcriptional regulator
MPRVTAAHEQQIRDRIVLAALRVFAERGFHRATVQDVVRESGLSVGAIYTYFAGKDELFLATCDLSANQGLGELGRRLARGRTTAEKLAIAVGFFLDAVFDPDAEDHDRLGDAGAAYLVQAWAEAGKEPAVREMLVRRREQLGTAARLLIEEGIVRGELPAWLDVEATAAAATALLDGLLLERIEEGSAFRRSAHERRARSIVELLLGAAAAPARPDVPSVPASPFPIVPSAEPRAKAS